MAGTSTDSVASQPATSPFRSATVGAGAIGALIASLCCVPPAAAVALGTSLATAAALSQLLTYRPLFVAAGLGAFALVLWMSLRSATKNCPPDARKKLIDSGLTIGVLSFAVVYLVVNQLVVPMLYNVRWAS